MATLRTLRATPEEGYPEIYLTYDYMLLQVKFYGKAVYLKRSEEKVDFFDIEFTTSEGATNTLQNCHINNMTMDWAPANITDKKAVGIAKVSFQPPRFDYGMYNRKPSLPVSANNPYPTVWLNKKRKRPQDSARGPVKPMTPLKVEMDPIDPRPPFDKRHWPPFPRYSPRT